MLRLRIDLPDPTPPTRRRFATSGRLPRVIRRTVSHFDSKRSPLIIPREQAKLLEGKGGMMVVIANDRAIAWGCAKALRAFGAELAVTYRNDKAKKFVEPLARELEAPIFMPLDVSAEG